jgi:hypothetical protein
MLTAFIPDDHTARLVERINRKAEGNR